MRSRAQLRKRPRLGPEIGGSPLHNSLSGCAHCGGREPYQRAQRRQYRDAKQPVIENPVDRRAPIPAGRTRLPGLTGAWRWIVHDVQYDRAGTGSLDLTVASVPPRKLGCR